MPGATPLPVIRRLHEEAAKALANAEVKERLTSLGAEPFLLSPDAFNAYIRIEMESAARVARAANLKSQ